ncbi:hypothetical protein [Lutibacter sp.]|uniref:hypothetical protein n=1 Tax=Lutibacter sp. TaxID=1925666 RepID=UPI0025C3FB9C|nr:hypothetical protein [Lutibacter sp.]MCF6182317.1 hypothetical protein [Lutibacter sp.]
MKKQLTVLLIAFLGLINHSYGQTKDADQKFGIKWHGFVKVDYMFDSRQTVNAREGHFLLFPSGENIDIATGDDLNSQANFNILAVQTRLTGKITGPDFFGMKTSGVIEGAFFGQSNANINSFRLRHAFIKLSNDKIDIILGQYWHPMFVTAVFPGTYSFNTGVPFQPFSRNPQFRITTKGNIRFIGVIFSERDFASRGPIGTTSKYVRDAAIPQLHAQLQFGGKEFLGGFGVNLKTLRPALGADNVSNTAFIGYMKTKLGAATFKLEGIYGENMSDLLSISGMAEDTNGGYTSNKTFSVWGEISGSKEHFEWGLFSGYTKNDGFKDAVAVGTPIYGLAPTMDYVFRVSPRIGWKSGKMKLGVELEYTSAQYGKIDLDGKSITSSGDAVNNFRTLVTAVYAF